MTQGPRCGGCPLKLAGGTGWVIEDGRGDLKIAIIAEAPGESEAEQGKPLVGPTGKLLNRIITRMDHPFESRRLKRDDFWLSNIIRCRPPDNFLTGAPWEDGAIAQCAPYLVEWLREKKPRAIIALGNQALRWFTGQWGIDKLRGYIWETKWGPVIGSYHPAFVMKGKWPLARMVQLDITRAIEVAEKGVPRVEKTYTLRPGLPELLAFERAYLSALRKDAALPLSFDIETPHSNLGKDEEIDPEEEEINIEDDASYTILRMSFAFEEGRAITFPWQEPFIGPARRMLASEGPKVGWNCINFDIPRLEANGCPVNGRVYDGMDMFHFLEPALPMGLKYAATIFTPDMPPWKLRAKDEPEWYSAADSDVALRCVERIRRRLEEQGRWDTFERHFVDLALVLRRMSQRGILVDRAQRGRDRDFFLGEQARLVEDLQQLVPDAVKPRKVYKLTRDKLKKRNLWIEGRMVENVK